MGGTLADVLRYLVQTACSLYLLAVLMRLLLQLARADFYNPISQFVVRVTNPLVLPLRRLIPALGRIDTATVLVALAVQVLGALVTLALMGGPGANLMLVIAWSALGLAALIVNIYFFAILAMIIFSWIAPHAHHPALALLYQLTEPVMSPFRRLLPPMGGLDFSPILVFVVINVVKIMLSGFAQQLGMPQGLVIGI